MSWIIQLYLIMAFVVFLFRAGSHIVFYLDGPGSQCVGPEFWPRALSYEAANILKGAVLWPKIFLVDAFIWPEGVFEWFLAPWQTPVEQLLLCH